MSGFHQRLSVAMERRGIKQVDLINATGIGKSSMSTYLSGEYLPKQRNLYKIARALGVDPAWLLDGVERDGDTCPEETWHAPLAAAYEQADTSTRVAACNVLRIGYVDPDKGKVISMPQAEDPTTIVPWAAFEGSQELSEEAQTDVEEYIRFKKQEKKKDT